MTNPTPYRNKTTGTIAWLNKPYENWESIAKVLDALGIEAQFVSYICRRGWENDDLACLHCTDFPITITALPDDEWVAVELCEHCDDVEANKGLHCWNCGLDWSVINELMSKPFPFTGIFN